MAIDTLLGCETLISRVTPRSLLLNLERVSRRCREDTSFGGLFVRVPQSVPSILLPGLRWSTKTQRWGLSLNHLFPGYDESSRAWQQTRDQPASLMVWNFQWLYSDSGCDSFFFCFRMTSNSQGSSVSIQFCYHDSLVHLFQSFRILITQKSPWTTRYGRWSSGTSNYAGGGTGFLRLTHPWTISNKHQQSTIVNVVNLIVNLITS